MKCPACATQVPDGARFCPSCGHLLHARADERRIVTVLFADLVGFTSFSEGRDPEQVKNLVDRCFERLVGDINAFGGRVDKIVGDAIVALFGAPVAHEDDAERAVRAALQMQRTLATVTGELDSKVQLRIGVNTGEVLVGALRAGGDYTAMGDVVNVASRLQTLAVPGQVVVGPATRAATREVVEYECLGEVQARGREESITAWRALAALAPPGYRPRRTPTPLVGRSEELGVLRHTLAAAVGRRRAHLVLLIGEAGIGKSRLAEEMAHVARAENGALVLEGRCVPYGEANVWWPVAEAVRQACGIEPTDPADVSADKSRLAVERATGLDPTSEEASRLADGLLYLMGDEDALPNVDPTRAAEDARRSLLALLEAMAAQQPIMLVLSELHWADKLVLDLVDQLLDRLRHLPVVLVATARLELEDRWAPKPSRHNLIALHLDPLDEQAGRDLLTALLGEEPPRELRDALLERSGGNPFFLEELVALLSEAGVLRGDAWLSDSTVTTSELPATLRGLVAARLDALPADERSVLEDAAVFGRTGPVAALAMLAETRGVDFQSMLRDLSAKDLLALLDGEFEFRSELVREVAYETLTKAERARRHAALAEWLSANARATGREDEYLEQLAHHYGEAAELDKELGGVDGLPRDVCDTALQAIERAAVRAKQRDMHAVSIPLLDRALRLLPPGPGRPMRRVLLERARARTHLHDLGGARADLAEVFAQIEGGVHQLSRARALTVQGQILQTEGDLAGSAAALDEAIAGWRALGDARGEAEALSMRGMTSLFAGQAEEAEASIRQALEVFRSLGASRDEAWALWNLAWISFEEGRLTEAEARLEKSAATFTEARDWGGLAWAHGLLGFVKYFQGERRAAEAIAERVMVGIEERGDRWAHGMVLVLLGAVRLWDGRTTEAIDPAREAVRLFTGIADIRGQGLAYATLSRALVAAGRVREGVAVLDEADQAVIVNDITLNNGFARAGVANHMGDPQTALAQLAGWKAADAAPADMATSEGNALHGLALLQSGDVEGALDSARKAVDAAPAPGSKAAALALVALVLAAARRPTEALEAAETTLSIEVHTYLDNVLSLVATACALVQLGDEPGARAAFDQAEAVVDATGDRIHQAGVRLARARALEALGAADACEALDEARVRLAQLDIPATGWDTAYRLAAGALAPQA
ncbi:MAG TPA: adenylate/guanylate cyclase domain-containing protein [Acidimicrobiales bacterium]|nr:adenylate/guanylate cyclase domain-containing protein [Acidimicrobiales bacterium]